MRTIGISLALPLFLGGVLLVALGGAAFSAAEAAEDEAETQAPPAAAAPADDDEPGYGYVFALPDDADPIDAAAKAAQMERAAVLARLGAGWERGEILSDDLRILVASARSQLAVYQEELARLDEADESDVEAFRQRHAEAQQTLRTFEEAGERLQETMVGLHAHFERLEHETERRALRPAP